MFEDVFEDGFEDVFKDPDITSQLKFGGKNLTLILREITSVKMLLWIL